MALAEEYATGAAEKNRLEKRLKVIKPVLEAAMGGAPMATAGKRILTQGEVAAVPSVPAKTITAKMVGDVIPGKNGRAGYTTLEAR
ncbi:hypothetical protein BKE38_01855 [Pseudoroseomonas deserti]|uniref:Uncharacterized protein n=1 Tax=Teichococcus deserti TaxID=1817963 RepID=A0A1V2H7S6_9PROT|nr:hypothetical protein [Pseudoroseomonas deserti]ONG58801.1 hypothetical protein BKE38_01855 [Pseudoroseomonas deserti]